MTSKNAPSSKTPARPSKPRSRSPKPAQPALQPETVKRYQCEFICVIGFPQATKDALGPDLLKEVMDELNTLGLRIVFQDERSVVNLSTHILATQV
jgi:hypothetical protein